MATQGYYEFVQFNGERFELPFTTKAGNIIHNLPHWHDSIEVLVAIAGSFSLRINDQMYHIQPGGLCVIDAGQSHEVFSGGENHMQLLFTFDCSLLRRAENTQIFLCTSGPEALAINHPDVIQLRTAVMELNYLGEKYIATRSQANEIDPRDWYMARHWMNQSFLAILPYIRLTDTQARIFQAPDSIQRCIRHVQNHYTEPLCVEQLAADLGYSRSSIYRLFHIYTGTTLHQYLTNLRLDAACELLREQRLGILEIADASGFQSVSSFYRAFKDRCSISPLEYRERFSNQSTAKGQLDQSDVTRFNIWQPMSQLPYSWQALRQLNEEYAKA